MIDVRSDSQVAGEKPQAKLLSPKVNKWQFFHELPGPDTGKYQVALETTPGSEQALLYYGAYHCMTSQEAMDVVLALHAETSGLDFLAVFVEGTCADGGEYSYQGVMTVTD